MRQFKKTLSLLVLATLVWAVFALVTPTAQAATVYTNTTAYTGSFAQSASFDEKIAVLKQAYPEGWYWNYHDQANLNGKLQKKVTVNNVSYYISQLACPGPRNNHSGSSDRTICCSNHYSGSMNLGGRGGWQCTGYARTIYDYLWDNANVIYYKNDNNVLTYLQQGDMVYNGSHAFLVTNNPAEENGVIRYTDCNGYANCIISWKNTSTIAKVAQKMASSSGAYVVLHHDAVGQNITPTLRQSVVDSATQHEYRLYEGHFSWSQAKTFAESLGDGWALACMDGDSASEQSIIESLVGNFNYACWLGGYYSDGSWKWVSGKSISATDSRWDSGEPSYKNSQGVAENYIGIYANDTQSSYATKNKWNDFASNSNTIKGFVVEYTANKPYEHNPNSLQMPSKNGNYEHFDLTEFQRNWNGKRNTYYSGTINGADLVGVSLYICDVDENNQYTYYCGENGHGSGRNASVSGKTSVDILEDLVNKMTWVPQPGAYWTWIVIDTEESHYEICGGVFYIEDSASPDPEPIVIAFERPTGSVENRISAVQQIMPDGWYWNNWATVPSGGRQYIYQVGNNSFGVSNVPCDSSHAADQKYWGYLKGSKGCGFARTVYNLVWNLDTEANSYSYRISYGSDKNNPATDTYFLDYLSAGDMVFTGNYYFITGVSGNTITYAACNRHGDCQIAWNQTMTRDQLRSEMIASSTTDCSGYVLSPTPKGFSSSVFQYKQYEVTATSLAFKKARQSSSSFATSFTLSKGDKFMAATNHLSVDDAGKAWAYCNYNGKYGWMTVNDTSKCKEVANVSKPFDYDSTEIILPQGDYETNKFTAYWASGDLGSLFGGTIAGDNLKSIWLSIYYNPSDIDYLSDAVAIASMDFTEGTYYSVNVCSDLATRFNWSPKDGSYDIELAITVSDSSYGARTYYYGKNFRLYDSNSIFATSIVPAQSNLTVVSSPFPYDVAIRFNPANTTYKDLDVSSNNSLVSGYYVGGDAIHFYARSAEAPYNATLMVTYLSPSGSSCTTYVYITVIPADQAKTPTGIRLNESEITFWLNNNIIASGEIEEYNLWIEFEPGDANYITLTTNSTDSAFYAEYDKNYPNLLTVFCKAVGETTGTITVNSLDANGQTTATASVNVIARMCPHLSGMTHCECGTPTPEGLYLFTRVCDQCGNAESWYEAEPAHTFDPEEAIIVGPTCAAVGSYENVCIECGSVVVEALPKLEHTAVTDPAVAATCTTAGKTEGSHCSVCGTVITAQQVIPAPGHDSGKWVVVKKATTTEEGLKELRCTKCSTVLNTETIAMIVVPDPLTISAKPGDQITARINLVSQEAAFILAKISADADVFEFVSASGAATNPMNLTGSFVVRNENLTVVTSATLNLTLKLKNTAPAGSYAVTVVVSEAYDINESNATVYVSGTNVVVSECEHNSTEEIITREATCQEGAIITVICRDCGAVVREYTTNPNPHRPQTIGAVEPTCTQTGLTEGSYCPVCGETLTAQQVIPAKGHTPVTDAAVEATCTEGGLTEGSHCSDCGEILVAQSTTPPKGHTIVTDAAIEATCTEGGLTEGSHCSVCGEILVAQSATPPKGHTIVTDPAVTATCTTGGKTEGSHCSVCGTVITAQSETPPTGHTLGEWVVETEPTTTSEGLKVQKCTICGVTLQSETIPPLQPVIDDGTVAPTAGTVRGKAGETIEVKVYINSEKAALAYVRVHFDSSVLEFVSASGGSVQPQGNDGTFVFGSGFSAFKSETGTIQLKIKDGAQQGNYPVTTAVLEAYDADGEEVIAKAAADKVQVSNKLPGDVDDNGKVNGRDALLLLQYTAGWNVNINTINADVDANGKVNGRDALLLLQYTAGWSITLK